MKFSLKKILVFLGIVITVSTTTNFLEPTPASAADCRYFLGMTSWDCKTTEINSQDSLKSNIAQIATNVLADISVIASYLILGYVMYGGILYITSSGDANKTANAKKTLLHAFIGLAIVVSAYTIFSGIRIALIGNNALRDCTVANSSCTSNDGNELVTNLIQWLSGIVGVVSAIFILVGAWGYITSAGDPAKLQKAKQTILYAVIGLIVFALAQLITAFVSSTVRDANSYVNNSNIANINKESYEIHQIN